METVRGIDFGFYFRTGIKRRGLLWSGFSSCPEVIVLVRARERERESLGWQRPQPDPE